MPGLVRGGMQTKDECISHSKKKAHNAYAMVRFKISGRHLWKYGEDFHFPVVPGTRMGGGVLEKSICLGFAQSNRHPPSLSPALDMGSGYMDQRLRLREKNSFFCKLHAEGTRRK